MEIVRDFANNQLALCLPAVVVIGAVVLIYAYSIKCAQQPPFNKITLEDRKQQAGKKKKIKEKKATANGHVSTGEGKTEKSPSKEPKRSPAKEDAPKSKKERVENKQVVDKNTKNEAIKNKVILDTKNKKNIKKIVTEKPLDFDDGNWETVPIKSEKKKKPDQSPAKKDKKSKKPEKQAELDKLVKEVVNKELREIEKEVIVEKPVEEPVKVEEPVVIVEEKKEKKKEKKVKKEAPAPVVKEEPVQKAPPKPKVEVVKEEAPKAPAKESGAVAFDELGDVWTEAKVAKKSKKKARRDN